jgi:hypothetical protein
MFKQIGLMLLLRYSIEIERWNMAPWRCNSSGILDLLYDYTKREQWESFTNGNGFAATKEGSEK